MECECFRIFYARTLHRDVQEESPTNFSFTWNLGKALILPHIQKRYDEHRRRMVEPVTKKMAKVLGVPVARPAKGGRCYLCYEKIKGERLQENT